MRQPQTVTQTGTLLSVEDLSKAEAVAQQFQVLERLGISEDDALRLVEIWGDLLVPLRRTVSSTVHSSNGITPSSRQVAMTPSHAPAWAFDVVVQR